MFFLARKTQGPLLYSLIVIVCNEFDPLARAKWLIGDTKLARLMDYKNTVFEPIKRKRLLPNTNACHSIGPNVLRNYRIVKRETNLSKIPAGCNAHNARLIIWT